MKTAFIFSGQGSQTVGMGLDLYNNFQVARDVFDEVDETLHQKLSSLMFQGDLTELTQTQNAQPAIMTVGMAVVRVLEKELGMPLTDKAFCMAGHSLGEYTALCSAGSLSLVETANLLQIRGREMAKAAASVKGGMSAVLGLTHEQIAQIVAEASADGEYVFVANDNCPGQIIISGHVKALERASVLAEKKGAKRVVPLAVTGAFHSPYMQKAAEAMIRPIEDVKIKAPKVPVVANVVAEPENNPEKIKENLLVQITRAVRWRESVNWMLEQGVDTFIECANGRVMAGLIHRMTADSTVVSVGDSTGVKEVLSLF